MAAITRTSTLRSRGSPTGSITRSCKARRILACNAKGISPTSSRNSVPLSACMKRPTRSATAPVNAPLRWPNISLSSKPSGMAAQLTATKGWSARLPCLWMARATISLPVPLSPVSRMVALLSRTESTAWSTWRNAGLSPTRLSNCACSSSSARMRALSRMMSRNCRALATVMSSSSMSNGLAM